MDLSRRRFTGTLLGVGGLSVLGACTTAATDAGNVRLLNASVGYSALDLYLSDSKVQSSVAYGATTSYVEVSAGTLTTAVTNAGSTTVLSTASRTYAADAAYTVVAYGAAGSLKTLLLDENRSAADSGKADVMVLNLAIDAGALDVYLLGSSDSLDDAVALTSNLAGGSTLGSLTITAGSYRLVVTGYGDRSDVRLDVATGFTATSTQNVNLVLTQGAGGVLVNALLLPQGGSVTALANTTARVRVVSSVAGGAVVAASLAGTTLLGAATSPQIGDYTLVTAGTQTLSLTVAGQTVTSSQTLTAGADYTVLVWGSASAPTVTLVSEDNTLPTSSSKAKVRLVNLVNGLSNPLSLLVDYSALASNVTQGAVSTWAAVTASSAMTISVTSTASSTALYTLSDLTLVAKSLYTMFAVGDSSSPTILWRREKPVRT